METDIIQGMAPRGVLEEATITQRVCVKGRDLRVRRIPMSDNHKGLRLLVSGSGYNDGNFKGYVMGSTDRCT